MSGRLYGLDALRGVAAGAVAFNHFCQIFHMPLPPLSLEIAVDLFFILSGFVMARTYEERLRSGLSTLRFIEMRYRRLFPPLALGSTVGLAWIAATYGAPAHIFAVYALALCFLPAIVGGNAFPLNPPAWSLFVEILCNFVHGAICSKLSNFQLLVVAVATVLIFATCAVHGVSLWRPGITGILWLIPRELACYLVGIWMFRTYGDRPLGRTPVTAIVAFAAVLWLAWMGQVFQAAALIACPFIVRASLGLPRVKWARWAGALSYPLYASHYPILQAARAIGLPPVTSIVGAIAVAAFITVAFEVRRSSSRVPIPRPNSLTGPCT